MVKELYYKYVIINSQEDWNKLVDLLDNTDFYLWITGEKAEYSDYSKDMPTIYFDKDDSIVRDVKLPNNYISEEISLEECINILQNISNDKDLKEALELVLTIAEGSIDTYKLISNKVSSRIDQATKLIRTKLLK